MIVRHDIEVLVDRVHSEVFNCVTRVESDVDRPLMDFMRTTITPPAEYPMAIVTCHISAGELEVVPLVIKHFIEGRYRPVTEQRHLFECLEEDTNG